MKDGIWQSKIPVEQSTYPYEIRTDSENGNYSGLKLFENGIQLGPQHASGEEIRSLHGGRYSYWNGTLYFSTLDGSDPKFNNKTYEVIIPVEISNSAKLYILLCDFIFIFTCFFFFPKKSTQYFSKIYAIFMRSIFISWHSLGLSAFLLFLVFLFYTIRGIYLGDELPTTRFLSEFQLGNYAGELEPKVYYIMIINACIGFFIAWTSKFNDQYLNLYRYHTAILSKFWTFAGFPILSFVLLLALSGGGWMHEPRRIDQNYMSIAGLIPNSDAFGYYQAAMNFDVHGIWNALAARRPIAQSFRDITVLAGGFSYSNTLIVQTLMLAAALFFASKQVAKKRGPWTALLFVALVIGISRPFIFTTMTEILAVIITLLSVPLLLTAFSSRSPIFPILVIFCIDFAMAVRMGALIIIPGLSLWAMFYYGKDARKKLFIFSATIVVLSLVISTGQILTYFYGPTDAATGGNFSMTVCGLSIGGNWADCAYHRYAAELSTFGGDEKKIAAFLFKVSLENILKDPSTFIHSTLRNSYDYIHGVASFYVNGYISMDFISNVILLYISILLLPALIYVQFRRSSPSEQGFWAVLVVCTIASAALVMADDGWRVLVVTHVLIALLIASVLTSPENCISATTYQHSTISPVRYFLPVGVLFLASTAGPALLYSALVRELKDLRLPEVSDSDIALGAGNFMTGFIVGNDTEKFGTGSRGLSITELQKLVKSTPYATDRAALSKAFGRVPRPFALVWAMPLKENSMLFAGAPYFHQHPNSFFVVPTEVLENSKMRGWVLKSPNELYVDSQISILSATNVVPIPEN